MNFEILLDNIEKKADKARTEIENKVGLKTDNFVESGSYPAFGNFIEIETQSSEKDAWEIQEELMKIEGVVDVDPEIDKEDEEEKIQAQYLLESKLLSTSYGKKDDPEWFHKAIGFSEAVKYAIQHSQGQFDGTQRIKVAQLDTGYTDHPEVKDYRKNEGYNFMRREDAQKPYDTLKSTRPFPILWGGHGTSCAGVMIGAHANNQNQDPDPDSDVYESDLVNGVFSNIDLVPFRVSKSIISFNNKMSKAIHMVIDRGDIPIISISHATLRHKRSLELAIIEAVDKGIIVVAAPGSHIHGFKRIFTFPAKYSQTIAPAASTREGMPWSKTHGGPEVDLCAPGYEIYIPFPYLKKKKEYYGYKWSEGSSFSVPITASAAALWMLHHGVGHLQARYQKSKLLEIFREAIINTSRQFSGAVQDGLYGSGILNVENLLKYPLDLNKPRLTYAKRYIAGLKRRLDNNRKVSYQLEKELTYYTLLGKIETDEYKNELRDYVMDNVRSKVKENLGKADPEKIKKIVKNHVNYWYS